MLICCLKLFHLSALLVTRTLSSWGPFSRGCAAPPARASPLLLCYTKLTETAQACWWFLPPPQVPSIHIAFPQPILQAPTGKTCILGQGIKEEETLFLWEFNEVDFQCTEFRCLRYVWVERSKEQFMSMDLSIRKVSRGALSWNVLTCTEYY